jgi:uncharacterized membrane protein YhaH (DUF805 family)
VGLVSLLFSFRGRINRLQYWLGSLGVGVGAVLLVFVLALLVGVSAPFDKQAGLQGAVALLLILGLVGLVASWSGLALQVKRFHDRGQPGWLSLLPVLPTLGLVLSVIGGLAAQQSKLQLASSMQPYMLALWAIDLFFFVNLGCLAGTDGPNKYGPPPGAPRAPKDDPSPRAHTPAPASSSLASVEAAMERAIAEKARQPANPLKAAEGATVRPAASSFGRRVTS